MNTLLIYMVKVAVYLTAFYLVYLLLLSRDTAYGRNRAFILISMASAIILPFISFQTVKPLDIQFFGKLLSDVFVTANPEGASDTGAGLSGPGALRIMYTGYIFGVIIFMLKLLIDLLNLLFLIYRGRKAGTRIIRFHGFNTAGFSAMGYIFINTRLNPEEADEIIRHEQNHLRQNHFIDIIFVEIIKAFQWFNPVIYLINTSLRAIHEFQADQDCLNSGVPVVNYQSLLLSQVFKTRAFNLTNSFSNPSLIKRRMIMMTKKRTSAIAAIKLLLVIPVTILVFLAISAYREIPENFNNQQVIQEDPVQNDAVLIAENTTAYKSEPEVSSVKPVLPASTQKNTKQQITKGDIAVAMAPPPPPPPPSSNDPNIVMETNTEENVTPFVVVEEMPMFPGGDKELLNYIGETTRYPEIAKANNIQGKVVIRFCVTATGGVSQISVLKGVSPELDEESMRVVSTLPAFRPGKQGGKPVPVWYMVPITFTLN
jgi:TonB family protein